MNQVNIYQSRMQFIYFFSTLLHASTAKLGGAKIWTNINYVCELNFLPQKAVKLFSIIKLNPGCESTPKECEIFS